MLIVSIRTERSDAEVGLFDNQTQLAYDVWPAHRELSNTLHNKIKSLLAFHSKGWHDIQGIVCFSGPGSFTGLRIGITVGNALAYGLKIPVVASKDPDWLHGGIARLLDGCDDTIALPEYGAPVHITQQKK